MLPMKLYTWAKSGITVYITKTLSIKQNDIWENIKMPGKHYRTWLNKRCIKEYRKFKEIIFKKKNRVPRRCIT